MGKMWGWVLGVVVVVALIWGGVALFGRKNGTTPAPKSTSTNTPNQTTTRSDCAMTAAVEINARGFSPSSVCVKQGGSVTWTNKDSQGHWVASNPHPTHTDYPGFDALRTIGPGETYSFTFDKKRTWGYHDHLNTGMGGKVEVVAGS